MRLLAITHADARDPGLVAERAVATGAALDTWCGEIGEPRPANLSEYDGIVVLGGGANVVDAPARPWLRGEIALVGAAVRAGTPVLGICLGAQILAAATGGEVIRSPEPEVGWYAVRVLDAAAEDPLFAGLPPRFEAYHWHSWAVTPPPGAVPLAVDPICLQAYRVGSRAWGVQFHPEVTAEILGSWIPDYPTDPDAARIGGDPAAALAEVPTRLPAWNAVGRSLADAWLAEVERYTSSASRSLERAT